MRKLLFCLPILFCFGCKKDNSPKLEIYLLKSFAISVNQTTTPAFLSVTNAVMEEAPLVENEDIISYTTSTATFKLRKDIRPVIQHYSTDKAFVVTVNKEPVYYGVFHPSFLSSITFGLATIDPIILVNKQELVINFVKLVGNPTVEQLDKRNDARIRSALAASGRLRL